MELRTALDLKDVGRCRELLGRPDSRLAQFKAHELAALMDAAIGAGAAADELISLLLEAGVPAHSVHDHLGPSYQHTPLVTAARLGRLDLIQKLVAAGADLFWASPTGANILSSILASRASQDPVRDTPELAQVRGWLIEQGLRIDPLCADSRRKLFWASRSPRSWADVPGLLGIGIPLEATGWTPFMLDLALGKVGTARVNALATGELEHRDAWSRTPFLLAVAGGQLEIAKALVGHGSDLRALGQHGATALSLAAEFNHVPVLEWLLENGMPLAAWNTLGPSALREAVWYDSVAAARLLLEKGGDIHERDKFGSGLMHRVDFGTDLTMLDLLMKAGAAVDDESGGCWPLHDACEAGNAAAVALLLRAGADPNLTTPGGPALFAAVSKDSLECVRLLVEAGANVNATDCDRWTSLFHLRSECVADYLLAHGADPGISDLTGGLPEDWRHVPISVRRQLRARRIARAVE